MFAPGNFDASGEHGLVWSRCSHLEGPSFGDRTGTRGEEDAHKGCGGRSLGTTVVRGGAGTGSCQLSCWWPDTSAVRCPRVSRSRALAEEA